MKWFLSRMSEPSSYAGFSAALSAIFAGLSGSMPPSVAIAAGVTGVVAFLRADTKPAG